MLHLGLSADDRRALHETLVSSHKIRLDVAILNRGEQEIASLTAPINKVVAGAVQVDVTGAVTRSLSLTVVDPKGKLRFEANSPVHGAIYADKFLAVRREVYVPFDVVTLDREVIPGPGDWIPVPVFQGPLTNYERNGKEVTLEAQGKEALMLEPHFATQGYTIHKNTRLDDAIRQVADRAGERRYNLPDLPHRLHRARVVRAVAEPWLILTNNKSVPGFAKKRAIYDKPLPAPIDFDFDPAPGLIDSAPGHLTGFYDGPGRLTVRPLNRESSHTFKEGRDLIAGSPVQQSHDALAAINYVRVDGGKLKGKPQAVGHAALPPANPQSAQSLARHGELRYKTAFVTADNLKTDDECTKRAHEVLERLSQQGVELAFTCLPLPMLEENDVVTVQTEEFTFDFQVRQFTIPLDSSAMTIGHHEKVDVGRHRTRRWLRRHRGGGRAGPPGGTGGSR